MKRNDYSFMIWKQYLYITPIDLYIKNKRSCCLYKCICWKIKEAQPFDIINGKVKSCWCYNKSSARERWYKHKLSWHKLYRLYYDILSRCNNKNKRSYKDYWWRGIICERKSFEEFYNDMLPLYNQAKILYKIPSIERIDFDWNYSKDNCIFIENSDQSKNRSTNYNIEWMTLIDYCKKHNLKTSTMYSRMYREKSRTKLD